MITKEQLAHDLTMVYLNNIYGIEVKGYFNVFSGVDEYISGDGEVYTTFLPDLDTVKYKRVPTGEKRFFNLIKDYKKIEDGYEVDEVFSSMIELYYKTYKKILKIITQNENNI